MFKVLKKVVVAQQVDEIVVDAPHIATHAKAGNFIVLRLHEKGERIPLTIADANREEGTITLLFQKVGKTTLEMGLLRPGDIIRDIAGPLGHKTPIANYGHCVLVGGGIGAATLFPILKALKNAGNEVTMIMGARTEELLVWKDRFGNLADRLLPVTDDGSLGRKGIVTDLLKDVIEENNIAVVVAVGPIKMMKAVSDLTRAHDIKTIVSLNPIMVEGTGMCGACRVKIDGETKFACIEGPEFDGHEVDFDELINRLGFYREEEKLATTAFKEKCKGSCGNKVTG